MMKQAIAVYHTALLLMDSTDPKLLQLDACITGISTKLVSSILPVFMGPVDKYMEKLNLIEMDDAANEFFDAISEVLDYTSNLAADQPTVKTLQNMFAAVASLSFELKGWSKIDSSQVFFSELKNIASMCAEIWTEEAKTE